MDGGGEERRLAWIRGGAYLVRARIPVIFNFFAFFPGRRYPRESTGVAGRLGRIKTRAERPGGIARGPRSARRQRARAPGEPGAETAHWARACPGRRWSIQRSGPSAGGGAEGQHSAAARDSAALRPRAECGVRCSRSFYAAARGHPGRAISGFHCRAPGGPSLKRVHATSPSPLAGQLRAMPMRDRHSFPPACRPAQRTCSR